MPTLKTLDSGTLSTSQGVGPLFTGSLLYRYSYTLPAFLAGAVNRAAITAVRLEGSLTTDWHGWTNTDTDTGTERPTRVARAAVSGGGLSESVEETGTAGAVVAEVSFARTFGVDIAFGNSDSLEISYLHEVNRGGALEQADGFATRTAPKVLITYAEGTAVLTPAVHVLRHPVASRGVPLTLTRTHPRSSAADAGFTTLHVGGGSLHVANALNAASGLTSRTATPITTPISVPLRLTRNGPNIIRGRYRIYRSRSDMSLFGDTATLQMASPSEANLKRRLAGGKWFYRDKPQAHYFKEMDAIEVKS